MPENTFYSVKEDTYTEEGYVQTVSGESGMITEDNTQTAAFVNTKNETVVEDKTGNLSVKKTVDGESIDKKREFTFIVTLNHEGSYPYSGSKQGTIKSGDKVKLAHNESITITGLPVGTVYRVVEDEANLDGYITKATGDSGIITESTKTASFVNTKSSKNNIAPKTGDHTNMIPWFLALGVSVLGLTAVVGLKASTRNGKRYRSKHR